jgi:uncharacterized protein (TIGR03085 family)
MTTPARSERDALSDLFLEVGPDAPTLCEGWTTRDLAAHLIVRERRLDASPGIVLSPLSGWTERVRRGELDQPWERLVELVRTGPPAWSPTRLSRVDSVVNTVEFFVHHEDVRRAQPDWEPRTLGAPLMADLAKRLGPAARMLTRRWRGGLVLETPAGSHRFLDRKGEPSAVVRGPVGELVLFVYGRQAHSRVEIEPADVADELRRTSFGL